MSRARAQALIAAEKQANLPGPPTWDDLTGADGVVFRSNLPAFAVVNPDVQERMIVQGHSTGPDYVQIMFLVQGEGRQLLRIARLCIMPYHPEGPHWHLFEDANGPTEDKQVSHPQGTLDLDELLTDIFLPTLNIGWQTGLAL